MRESPTMIALAAAVLWLPALHAQDRPLAWDFEEIYRVGGLDVPEWAQFTRSGDLAFDGAGNLYVLDEAARHVVKIGPDGRLVRTIGRAGEGPGEFGSPRRLVVWQDGSIAVTDGRRTAIQLFDADGNYARQVRWSGTGDDPLAHRRQAGRPMRPGPRPGVIWARGIDAFMSEYGAAAANLIGGKGEEGVDDRTIETLDLAGDVAAGEVLWRAWRPLRDEKQYDRSDVIAVAMNASPPNFEPDLRWDATPGGAVAYADSTTYVVRVIDAGELVSTVTRPIKPVQVTRQIESDLLEREMRRLDEESSPIEMPGVPPELVASVEAEATAAAREAIQNQGFYPEVPVITAVRAAWDRSLWIQRRGEEPWDEDGPIDVFDPDGNYLGTLPADGPGMPETFGPDGLIAYWERHELDVPSIVVQRVPSRLR